MCVPAQWCVWGMLTSREGGWKGPGVSLRRSEERRRLRLLREDSERSHSLPREAELCHYKRKRSQLVLCSSHLGSWLQPSQSHLWGHSPSQQPSPPFLTGYLRSSGSRAFSGPQKAIHGTSAGHRRKVSGQLRWGDAGDRGAAGRGEQLLEAGTQPFSGGAHLLLTATGFGTPPTYPF